jgi:hypothetical protein
MTMAGLVKYGQQDAAAVSDIRPADVRRLIRSGRLVEEGIYIYATEDEEEAA